MTNETTKFRDPNLVFVGMALGNHPMHDVTRAIWDRMADGMKIGPFTFIRRQIKSFSTAKARNMLTAMAVESNAGKLLMIDSDMNVGDHHLLYLLARPEAVIGALYPKKTISLKQLWVANFLGQPDGEGIIPCKDIGAGLLKVEMWVVEALIAANPKSRYLCEDDPWRGEPMWDLWENGVVEDDWNGDGKPWPRYLTEDFYFCWLVWQLKKQQGLADAGVYAASKCCVGHIGDCDYLDVVLLIQQLTTVAPEVRVDDSTPELPPISR